MANESLGNAKKAKNDEFYTQYEDIQKEVNAYLEYNPNIFKGKTILLPCDDPEWSNFTKFFAQNFENFGLKKLISTSYAANSKPSNIPYQLTFFETQSAEYDEQKTRNNGKIFTLIRDVNNSGSIDIDDLEWHYLDGDGDFRSDEIKLLRDEADIIITNPPFSLFREFLSWITEAEKQFLIIGNMNAITYKEVFPLMKENKMWLGESIHSGDRKFNVPDNYPLEASTCGIDEDGRKFIRVKGVRWFTNIDHGRRHQPLSLMSMADNLKFSKHKEIRERGYVKYDNYDAIEVPFTDAIPNDYFENIGVPITYLDKHCSEQFEIVGISGDLANPIVIDGKKKSGRFYVEEDCSQFVNVEREREKAPQTLRPNCRQKEDVTELLESLSPSLTNTVQSNLKSSGLIDMFPTIQDMDTDLQSQEKKHMQEYSSNINCNGLMGVPITFLDKYCPEQFEILGLLQSSSDEQAGTPNLRYYDDFKEMRQNMTFTGASGKKANGNPVLPGKSLKGNFLYNQETDEFVHSAYARILIRYRR